MPPPAVTLRDKFGIAARSNSLIAFDTKKMHEPPAWHSGQHSSSELA
jgi:hypothetical protein